MQNIKSKGTIPERLIAERLKKAKIYFSQHSSSLIGKPDFIFRKKKIVVFIDSCFWHKCQYHYIEPKSNLHYWIPKIERNKNRDKEVNNKLKQKGWTVIRFWEHQIKNDIEKCLNKIFLFLNLNE